MASQYAEWFTRISHDKDLFFLDPTELATLQSYLEGNLPLQDTISSLTAPTAPQWHSTQSSRVWAMLLSIAEEYGEAHDRIIDLIEALFSLPKPSQPNEMDWPGEKEFGFPRCWRDIHDSLWARESEIEYLSDSVATKWINYQAFTARLLASSLLSAHDRALLHTVDALEKTLEPKELTVRQDIDNRCCCTVLDL
ncbi:hypothetical protein BDV39DRAFT_200021 [Aspergillus sergii]|uniref:Uncharacterized protein n=1 Tax=Aspergillus sergii TaxID=1034303 RepID=A0A5N6XGM1_9EURO|nr:hypothetical protein BDV39DRAFT_200021 [Aspergillus sergii]